MGWERERERLCVCVCVCVCVEREANDVKIFISVCCVVKSVWTSLRFLVYGYVIYNHKGLYFIFFLSRMNCQVD